MSKERECDLTTMITTIQHPYKDRRYKTHRSTPNRTKADQLYTMLENICLSEDKGGIGKTQLMFQSLLSNTSLTKLLSFCMSNDLVTFVDGDFYPSPGAGKVHRKYYTTGKAKIFLRLYKGIHEDLIFIDDEGSGNDKQT
jgi:predicted transcriptional regulator